MTTVKTAAGLQHVLPGAERATDAERAARRAREPLRPSKPQLPCDLGLFGDSAAQSDLVELARKRVAPSRR